MVNDRRNAGMAIFLPTRGKISIKENCKDIDRKQTSLIPGATGSVDGPGWWKELGEVFHVD